MIQAGGMQNDPHTADTYEVIMKPIPITNDMNKTEAAFATLLEFCRGANEIIAWEFEPIKLRLAKKTFYTPDFLVVESERFIFYEVKGFWRDDARVKIKVAAETYPYFKFIAVQLKRKEWVYEEIKHG
ncbi:hypothetical protein LCGC14_2525450 [marine sediment metagenome]|uniref:DUF1064 domain-containing protein n=1 Tax=marine sediment metagenome TaxID=412755 RepID=A0A0F9AV49_9ZZZZ